MHGRLKVLMVGNLPIDVTSIKGGVEAAIINLFCGFSERSDITVLHAAFTDEVQKETEVNFSDNVRIIFLPLKSKYPLLEYFMNRGILRRLIARESPGIIHVQESSPHLLRFLGIPRANIVVTQHGIMKEELRYVRGIKSKAKFLFKYLVERYFFPSFRNVIFISKYNRALFNSRLEHEAHIYNPVNPVFFAHFNSGGNVSNAIIYVGVISRRKNIRLVVEALNVLRKRGICYALHVVGDFKGDDPEYKKEIHEMVRSYGLGDQITFHGWLKQAQILDVYDKCSYFILPSQQETLPISIAEAMAMGKVVMSSDVGAVSELFDNMQTGFLFERNDLDALVQLLERFYKNPLTSDQLVKIRNIAIARYHPTEVARRTVEFYQQVVSSTKAAVA